MPTTQTARTACSERSTRTRPTPPSPDRAAAGVVLPVPVRAVAHLQVAAGADPRHDHHPDDPDGDADRLAVPGPGRDRRLSRRPVGWRRPGAPAVLIALTIAGGRRPWAVRARRDRRTRLRLSWRRRPNLGPTDVPPATILEAEAETSDQVCQTGRQGPAKAAKIKLQIENGGGGMPAFKGTFPADQIQAITDFIVGLGTRHAACSRLLAVHGDARTHPSRIQHPVYRTGSSRAQSPRAPTSGVW